MAVDGIAWHGMMTIPSVPARGYVCAGGVYEGPEGNGYLLREAEGDLELPHPPPGAAGKR